MDHLLGQTDLSDNVVGTLQKVTWNHPYYL